MASSKAKKARAAYQEAVKKNKPFAPGGKRFKVGAKAAAASGAEDPNAVMAAAGMKKYGKANFLAKARAARKGKYHNPGMTPMGAQIHDCSKK